MKLKNTGKKKETKKTKGKKMLTIIGEKKNGKY